MTALGWNGSVVAAAAAVACVPNTPPPPVRPRASSLFSFIPVGSRLPCGGIMPRRNIAGMPRPRRSSPAGIYDGGACFSSAALPERLQGVRVDCFSCSLLVLSFSFRQRVNTATIENDNSPRARACCRAVFCDYSPKNADLVFCVLSGFFCK